MKNKYSEAVTQWCFRQKAQNSLENNCVGVLSPRSDTCNFIEKETPVQTFSCEFCQSFKITVFIEYIQWLLLKHFIYMSLYYEHNESIVPPFSKQNKKPQIITKFTPFLQSLLAERRYLTILNCECKHV